MDTPPVGTVKEIVGVYDADSSLMGEFWYCGSAHVSVDGTVVSAPSPTVRLGPVAGGRSAQFGCPRRS